MKKLFLSPISYARLWSFQVAGGQFFKLSLFLIPFLLLSLQSCELLPEEEDKKEEEVDDEEPEVDSISPDSGDGSLMGIVAFEIEVSDDEEIEEVEFRIYRADEDEEPGELLLEETIDEESFTITWDSELMGEDGNIIVEVIAIDESGNESDEETEIYFVRNDIIWLDDNLNYTNAYLWITDTETGDIIDELEIQNQVFSKKALRRKNGFSGAEVDYHIYDYSSSSGDTYLESFYGLSQLYHEPIPTELTWKSPTGDLGSFVVYFDFYTSTYDNVLLSGNNYWYGDRNSSSDFFSYAYSFPLWNQLQSENIYFYLDGYYAKVPTSTLSPDDYSLITVDQLSSDMSAQSISASGSFSSVYLYHNEWSEFGSESIFYPNQMLYRNFYDYNETQSADILFPTNDFNESYEFVGYVFKDDTYEKFHRHRAWGNVPTSIPTNTFDISLVDENVQDLGITTSGTYDAVRVVASAYDTDGNYHEWEAIGSDGEIPFPSIPQAISSIFPDDIFDNGIDSYIYASVVNYNHLQVNHMDDFVSLWLTNQEWLGLTTIDEVYISKYLDNSAGRHAKGQDLSRYDPEKNGKGMIRERKKAIQ